ncbi:MAG: zinc ribbon domain-containing protein [Methanobacteriota archaeon]|nr:MAG: zinc ribbon domain-containing protein [Euryarchaeota archaeon]
MADTDLLLIVLVVVIVLTIITFLELRFFRSFVKKRQTREDLPDRAHNALLTSKAIAESLRTSGVVTAAADDVIREADGAYRRRDYRVTIELADRAKDILKSEKARHDKMGDLSRLGRTGSGGSDEPTTKEVLQKELPPNYVQAKFTISLAEERIVAAREAGRATGPAEGFLATARSSFDSKDYDGALRLAVKSRRLADGEAIAEAPPPAAGGTPPVRAEVEIPRPANRACASCGSELLTGDTFCRKCGVKVERPTACPKCGTALKEDDAFCRTCGTAIS